MMRFLIPAAVLALLAVQAQAQTTTTTPDTTTPPAAGAPAATPAPAPTTAAPKKMGSHRMTLQQRFDAANVSHDGQLTKDQATAAKWSYVTKNFTAMDKDKKGYVTMDDIHAFAQARHAARKPAPAAAPATPAPATNG